MIDDTTYCMDIYNTVHLYLSNHRYNPAAKMVEPPFDLESLCTSCFPAPISPDLEILRRDDPISIYSRIVNQQPQEPGLFVRSDCPSCKGPITLKVLTQFIALWCKNCQEGPPNT